MHEQLRIFYVCDDDGMMLTMVMTIMVTMIMINMAVAIFTMHMILHDDVVAMVGTLMFMVRR